ncbi:MAG: signal peptidase II [Candidatus Omnitrophota bacterium]|nr:signal peptidase II [Candidatus Omnitrophota bacterium]
MTFLTALAILALDRLAKFIALTYLAEGQSVKVLPGIFHFTLVLNDGTAFGLFKGQAALFAVFSIVVIVFIVVYTIKNRSMDALLSLALGLILGGAAGNLVDRAWYGHVTDFLDFRIWPVFNIADSAITIGAAILMIKLFTHKTKGKVV